MVNGDRNDFVNQMRTIATRVFVSTGVGKNRFAVKIAASRHRGSKWRWRHCRIVLVVVVVVGCRKIQADGPQVGFRNVNVTRLCKQTTNGVRRRCDNRSGIAGCQSVPMTVSLNVAKIAKVRDYLFTKKKNSILT